MSGWLPSHGNSSGATTGRSAADVGGTPPPRGMPWLGRLLLTISAFAGLIGLVYIAMRPDLMNQFQGLPVLAFPVGLVWLVSVVLLMLQVSNRWKVKVVGFLFIAIMAGPFILLYACVDLYGSTVAETVQARVIERLPVTDQQPHPIRVDFGGDDIEVAYWTATERVGASRLYSTPGPGETVLLFRDRQGLFPPQTAYDLSAHPAWSALALALGLGPLTAFAVSALTRKESLISAAATG